MPATPPQNSMIAIWVASRSNRSRNEGRLPPYPPSSIPLTANMTITAVAAVPPASGMVGRVGDRVWDIGTRSGLVTESF